MYSNPGNSGRSYDSSIDLTETLRNHYNPTLALEKLAEVHSWLNKDRTFTDEELVERGWNSAYDLQTWDIYPGDDVTATQVVLQTVTRGRFGVSSKGASDAHWQKIVEETRSAYKSVL